MSKTGCNCCPNFLLWRKTAFRWSIVNALQGFGFQSNRCLLHLSVLHRENFLALPTRWQWWSIHSFNGTIWLPSLLWALRFLSSLQILLVSLKPWRRCWNGDSVLLASVATICGWWNLKHWTIYRTPVFWTTILHWVSIISFKTPVFGQLSAAHRDGIFPVCNFLSRSGEETISFIVNRLKFRHIERLAFNWQEPHIALICENPASSFVWRTIPSAFISRI